MRLDPEITDAWGIPVLRFEYRFGDNELRMANDMADSLEEMLTLAGAENIRINRDATPPGWSIHEIGTARMGADARTSVDGSVVPPARRPERLHRRCPALRLRRHVEQHVVDPGNVLADNGLPERKDAVGRSMRSSSTVAVD